MAVRHWVDALLTPRRDSEISGSSGGPSPKDSGSPCQLLLTLSCQGGRTLSAPRGRQIQQWGWPSAI